MKIKSSIVVAAAAGSALAPNAQAADMPVKAPTWTPTQTWNWTGLYVGGHLGAAWQKGRTTGAYIQDNGTRHGFRNSTGDTGFLGGGQIGYNWQHGNFVYGFEADISKLSGSGEAATNLTGPAFGAVNETSTNKINWIGTIRGRLGATFYGNNLIYVTGGWAYGSVKNTHFENAPTNPSTATWVEDTIRSGYAVGGGIEHMFTSNWIARLEGMYVDLGSKTLTNLNLGRCNVTCDPLTFTNRASLLRAAINYKF